MSRWQLDGEGTLNLDLRVGGDVALWHKADIATVLNNVCFRG